MTGSHPRSRFLSVLSLVFLAALIPSALSQTSSQPETPPIQDNSFLVEEAYNQEFGVVQHIHAFTRLWNSQDWLYTFTQEWPAPGLRNQLSYTVAYQHAGAFPASGAGIGDVFLNYRYQLAGSGETRIAFAPRLSLLFPTGDLHAGRSLGGFGLQTNLPVSVVVAPKLVTHWNVGGTFLPDARNLAGDHSAIAGYNLGQSFVYLAHSRFNLMLETVFANAQSVMAQGKTDWTQSCFVSPGVRWAYNFKSGLQIVPGIGVPIGAGPSAGKKGVFLYLSFEHPFRSLKRE